ncbi:hypothetical protein SRHO_G00016520 [Serrasalmus rhombeus]
MATELQELRDLVRQLQADNERLLREQATAQPPEAASNVSDPQQSVSNSTPAERLLYIPRERKCPVFRGRVGISIDDWSEEVQAMACTPFRASGPGLFYAGSPRGGGKRRDPESFFGRKQLEGESLQEFSHALLALMDKVKQSAPNIVLNSDVLVRDQFVEHVLDSTHRRELKRLVRQTPGLSMLQVRAEAIRWEREGRPEDSSRGDANNQGIMLGNVIMNVCQCVLWVIHIWVMLPLVPDYRKTSSLRCAEPHIGRGQYWLYPRKPDASFNYSFLSRTVSKGSSPFERGGS